MFWLIVGTLTYGALEAGMGAGVLLGFAIGGGSLAELSLWHARRKVERAERAAVAARA